MYTHAHTDTRTHTNAHWAFPSVDAVDILLRISAHYYCGKLRTSVVSPY